MGSLTREADREAPGLAKLIMKEERKKQIEEIFAKHDKDANGKLSVKELQAAVLAMNDDLPDHDFTAGDLERAKDIGFCEFLVGAVDKVGDNTVTCEEFITLVDKDMDNELALKNMVNRADKDGDGLLSAGELKTMLMKIDTEMGEDEDFIKMAIRMCAHDSTRKIKPEALISFMTDGPKENDPKEDAKRMFKMFDTDKDGYLSTKELAEYFQMWMLMLGDRHDHDNEEDQDFIKMTAEMML